MKRSYSADQLLESLGTLFYRLYLAFIYVFSVAPVIVVFVMSIGESRRLQIPPTGYTYEWYVEAVTRYSDYIEPFVFSLVLAMAAALIACSLGVLAGLAISKYSSSYEGLITGYFTAPLTVPSIVIGFAALIFFYQIQFPRGFWALLAAHAVKGVPYAVVFILMSIRQYDKTLKLSSKDLGADDYQTFRYVTFPLIKSGVFAGAIITFIVSFNNVPLSLFLTSPGETTLPLVIFDGLEYGFTADLAAISIVQVAVILVVVILINHISDIEEMF